MLPVWTQIVLLAVLSAPANGRSVTLDVCAEECFHECFTAGDKVKFTFEVVKGGFYDVGAKVMQPDHRVIYMADRTSGGNYTFTAPVDGKYTFCFSNREASLILKIVDFSIDGRQDVETEEKEPNCLCNTTQTDHCPSLVTPQTDVMVAMLRLEASFDQKMMSFAERIQELEERVNSLSAESLRFAAAAGNMTEGEL